jgi:lactosylceramide 4-alpha-galactosyltransferase
VSDRPLDPLGNNYVGLESNATAGSSVLSLARTGVGHEVAASCVEELRTNFRGNVWAHNGPGLLTRVLLKMCNCSRVSQRAAETACCSLHGVMTHRAV